jgi:hypothetical protein
VIEAYLLSGNPPMTRCMVMAMIMMIDIDGNDDVDDQDYDDYYNDDMMMMMMMMMIVMMMMMIFMMIDIGGDNKFREHRC